MRRPGAGLLLAILCCGAGAVRAQGTLADYGRAEALLEHNADRSIHGVVRAPDWIGATDLLRYRTSRPEEEWIVTVDARRNKRHSVRCHGEPSTCERAAMAAMPETIAAPGSDGGIPSPDGRWIAFVRDHDLHVRSSDGARTLRLTDDGAENYAYGEWADSHLLSVTAARSGKPRPARVLWSPDSRKLLSYRIDQRSVPSMPFVQWLPDQGYGARPQVFTARVPLPADERVTAASLVIFDVPGGHRVDLSGDPLQMSYDFIDIGQIWWDPASTNVLYVREERGFRTVRLMAADATTGESRALVEETTATSYPGGYDRWARQGTTASTVVWRSSRDGWQHLYRYDIRSGRLLGQLTHGPWAVSEVLYVDSRGEWIYFTAGGREPGRDPYLLHLYRVTSDGSQLQLLTPEDAHHEISFSPSGRYFLDRHSRVDAPPVAVLRRVDGTLVSVLEHADIGALTKEKWQAPERFRVKGRDGITDIYGVLYRPSNFDPGKRYPVVEDIYGGPQQVHAARSFTAGQPLAELGFAVVQIDGMGTPGRSQAFQAASYGKGFAEAGGLADHVAALRQLAANRPYLDLSRVGIYGYSGGGYAAARAVFDYPDFYKVAVAGAGSHDQYLYQFEWGEHFIGRASEDPEAYELQANPSRASSLRGHLLLAHGDLDDDVPLANTMQLVGALVAANKDFDLLIAPNRNHDGLYGDPYFIRRQWDYFVRHLLGVEPPPGYRIGSPARGQTGLPQTAQGAIDRLVAETMGSDRVPGVSVAVALKGELVWSGVYGLADLENRVPVDAHTRFRTASISKWLSATAAMRLVEEGKLDLDAPVQRYCSAYPRKRWPLLVRHLLNHTGGVRHYHGDNGEPRSTGEEREALAERMRQERIGQFARYTDRTAPVAAFAGDPLLFEPGTRFHYSSNGYRLLGCVLEGASGQSYTELMARVVFGPARMLETVDDDAWSIIPHRAAGYAADPAGGLRHADFRDVSENLPAGGHLSTASDLVRFALAFNSGRLLEPESIREMLRRPSGLAAEDTDGYYGFGIQLQILPGGLMRSHTGGQAGVSTCLYSMPDAGFAVAVLMNKEDAPARRLCAAIRDRLLEGRHGR